jgi:predicted ATPase
MLNSIEISNFKSFRYEHFNFERLTVFVGANASGKTSILQAIQWCQEAANSDPVKVFEHERHLDWLYTRGGRGDLSIELNPRSFSFGINASPPRDFSKLGSELYGQNEWLFTKTPVNGEFRADAARSVRSMVLLHLNAGALAKESYSHDLPPKVRFDGSGLPSVLAYMKLTDDEALGQIEHLMSRFVPKFAKIRIQKKTIHEQQTELVRIDNDQVERRVVRTFPGEGLLFDFTNAKHIPASSVSEGTLLLLGLLTILHSPDRPKVILIDDIDHGLHPLAQKHLISMLHSLLDEFPDLQIIATAHSPYLLDGLKSDEVRLVMTDHAGHSIVRQLSDHRDFQKWKDEMAPGEMWSLFGDQWEAGKETPR